MLFFKKKEIVNERGFTLMEAMVSISVIMIMSAVYLTSLKSTNQRIILDQAVAVLVSDLRLAQNMAMNIKEFNGKIPLGGYGVNISNSTSYIVFADCNSSSHKYDNSANCGVSNNVDEKVTERTISQGVVIDSFKDNNGNDINDIDFQPPHPIVYIDGAQTAVSAEIILKYGTSFTKKIIINRFTGQISVE